MRKQGISNGNKYDLARNVATTNREGGRPCILTGATKSYCTRLRRRGWKYSLEKSL
jgi:hypothetical protein